MQSSQPQSTSSITLDVWDFSQFAIKARFAKLFNDGVSRYPIYREHRFASRMDLQTLLDNIALDPLWRAQRVNSRSLLLDGESFIATGNGHRTNDYCSCSFSVWAESIDLAQKIIDKVTEHVGDTRISSPMFSIDWHFLTSKGDLENAEIEELANDQLLDAAYPELKTGVEDFISSYLASDETVLVLQGPPGTGKTRLIRAILGDLSRRKSGRAYALYTGDKKALESDEIFVKFITGWHDAFVVEDADHLLKPRASGNENLHRFLSIADGVVRAQGRKIIFSTNLPNVGDLDEALIRPGRCFARVYARALDLPEAEHFINAYSANQPFDVSPVLDRLTEENKNTCSLAQIYKAINEAPPS